MANLGLRGGGNHGIWEMPLVRIIKQSSYIYNMYLFISTIIVIIILLTQFH